MKLILLNKSSFGLAISYGLGLGATIVAVLWGIFIWKEFKNAPKGTNTLLGSMIGFYLIGLVFIIVLKLV